MLLVVFSMSLCAVAVVAIAAAAVVVIRVVGKEGKNGRSTEDGWLTKMWDQLCSHHKYTVVNRHHKGVINGWVVLQSEDLELRN